MADPGRRRIRLARLIARLNVGGPAIHTILLTAGLDPDRYESLLISGIEAPHEGNMLALAEAKGVVPVRIPSLGRELHPLRDLLTLGRVWRLLRRFRPDLIHTHTAKAGTMGRLAALALFPRPVLVHTFHGHFFHGYFGPVKTRVFLAIERWLARRTDAIIAVSPEVGADLLRYNVMAADKLHVIPLGLELDAFTRTARSGAWRHHCQVPEGGRLIGAIARLVPIKALERFLAALPVVLARFPDVRAVIAGDGECRAALEAAARRLGLSDRVHFVGFVADVAPLLADLDLVVLCSKNEGLPVSLIEALAAGVPVVGTAVGGVPTLLADGAYGRLVPADDEGPLLAEAMVTSLADLPTAQSQAAAGQTAVLAQYGSARLIKDLDHLYSRLVKEP